MNAMDERDFPPYLAHELKAWKKAGAEDSGFLNGKSAVCNLHGRVAFDLWYTIRVNNEMFESGLPPCLANDFDGGKRGVEKNCAGTDLE